MRSKSKNQRPKPKRPFVFLNLAITADGKIAGAGRAITTFSSPRDREHMLELRARADAVLSGARTVDSAPVTMGTGAAKYQRWRRKNGVRDQLLRVIVSGSGSVDPKAEIFRHRTLPLVILVSHRASAARRRRLAPLADAVKAFGRDELNFRAALAWLRRDCGVKRLLCEGGGEIDDALFRAGLVDELHLTICPKILGGRDAYTPADGRGFRRLVDAFDFQLKSFQRIGDEVFMVFRHTRRQ